MEKKPPAPEPTSPTIPCEGRAAAEGGIKTPESPHAPLVPVAAPYPTGTLPRNAAAVTAILNDLHGLIAYGELILGELACDPNRLAPAGSIIRLEDWLFYLTSRVFTGLGTFQTTGGTVPVKPQDFVHGPWLSTASRYLDRAQLDEILDRLSRHIGELARISPFRVFARPSALIETNLTPAEDEGSTEPSSLSMLKAVLSWNARRRSLERSIIQDFDAFIEPYRALQNQLAVGLLDNRVEIEAEAGPGPRPVEEPRPKWHARSGELHFEGVLIRKVSGRGSRISLILEAFEEEEWPEIIDNPLTGGPNARLLRDATDSLNKGHKGLHFSPMRNGTAVRWERRVDPETP